MNADSADYKLKAVDEIHRRIGRNLLRFQEMEIALKMVLPYMHPNAAPMGADAMRQYQKTHIDLKTLGYLLGQYKDAANVPSDFFTQSEVLIVAARNDLVHNFYKLPGVDLLHEDGLKQALDWLEKQFSESQEWYQYLRTQSLLVLLALMESNPQLAAQYGIHHEKLLMQLPPGLEYIDKRDPSRTTWVTTRIVRLLQQAERQTERRNGFTLLARAGKFIKDQSPDISPEEYGIGTLKDVLIQSRMFEVGVEADQSTVVYRSIGQEPASSTDGVELQSQWRVVREK